MGKRQPRRRKVFCAHPGQEGFASARHSLEPLEDRRLLAVVSPDDFETNDTVETATLLPASGVWHDLTLHRSEDNIADQDVFRILPATTGTLTVTTALADPNDQLRIEILDGSGHLTNLWQGSESPQSFPVVANEAYFVRLTSVSETVRNYTLQLSHVSAQPPASVVLEPFHDTGMFPDDQITGSTRPNFFLQADPEDGGLSWLDVNAAEGGVTAGAAVLVRWTHIETGEVATGYAQRRVMDEPAFEFQTPRLESGNYLVSAAVQVWDGRQAMPNVAQPATGISEYSPPLLVHIDAEPPLVSSPQLLNSSDSGGDQFDRVTHLRQPAFVGVTDPHAHVTVLANGLPVGTAAAGESGRWEVTVEPLIDGIYAMTTLAEDVAGNVGENPQVQFIEVDTLPPNTPHLDLLPQSDTGVSATDNLTSDRSLSFAFTTTDPNAADHLNPFHLRYRLFARSETLPETLVYDSATDTEIPAESQQGGYTNLTRITTTLPDLDVGEYNFKLEVEDRAGNLSHDVLLPVTIATVPGSGVSIDLLAASDSGRRDDDNVTGFHRPTIVGTGGIGGVVTLYAADRVVGRGVVGSDLSDDVPGNGLGAWQITTGSLDDGVYEFTALAESGLGSVLSDPLTVEIDTQRPNLPLLDLIPSSDTGLYADDNVTRESAPQVHFSTADTGGQLFPWNYAFRIFRRTHEGEQELVYSSITDPELDEEARQDGLTNLSALTRRLPAMADGVQQLKLEVEDRAGNLSAVGLLEVTIDTELRVSELGLLLDLAEASDSGMDPRDNVTQIRTPHFIGVAEPGAAVTLFADGVRVGTAQVGSDEADFVPGDGLGPWSVNSTLITDGVHQMLVQVEDLAGNHRRSEPLLVDIDSTPPNTPLLGVANATRLDGLLTVQGSSVELTMTTEDPQADQRLYAFNYKYRVYLRPPGEAERLVYSSAVDLQLPPEHISAGFTDLRYLETTLDDLPPGVHNLKLEVEDRAGNLSEDYLLALDVNPSALAPGTLRLAPTSDTGARDDDGVTGLTSPAFGGVGSVGARVRLWSGEELLGTTVVGSDASNGTIGDGLGQWGITSNPLDDGIYSVVAEFEDDFGNVLSTEAVQVEVDTLAPNTPRLDLRPESDSGLLATDQVTKLSELVFDLTTTDPQQSDHVFAHNYRYRLFFRPEGESEQLLYDSAADETLDREDGLIVDERLSPSLLLDIPDGVHNFKLEIEDRAGNLSAHTLLDVQLDTVLETLAGEVAIDLRDASDTGMSDRDNVTSKDALSLVGVAEVGASVTILAAGKTLGVTQVGSDETDFLPGDGLGAWNLTLDPLDDGVHELVAHVEDLAGNFLRSEPLQVEIDTIVPNTPLLDLLNDTGHSDHDQITQDPVLVLNLTTHDPEPDGGRLFDFHYKYRIYLRPEGGEESLLYHSAFDPDLPPENLQQGFTDLTQIVAQVGPLPEGRHNLKLEVEDRAGNLSHDFLLDVQIDTEVAGPPTIELSVASDSGVRNDDHVTQITSPTFVGTGEIGSTVRLLADDVLLGVAEVQSDASNDVLGDGLGRWEVTAHDWSDGVYHVLAEVEDWAGNVTQTETLTVEIDSVAPNLPFLDLWEVDDSGRHNDDNVTNVELLRFTATTEDPFADRHLELFPDGQNLRYQLFLRPEEGEEVLVYDSAEVEPEDSLLDGLTALNRVEIPGLAFEEGLHNFKLEVHDRAGNISHDFLSDLLVDRTAAPGTVTLAVEGDTGIWGFDSTLTDGITSMGKLVLAGTAEANNVVSVFLFDELVGTTVTQPFDGDDAFPTATWQLELGEVLSDREYEVRVTFEDLAGNRTMADDVTIDLVVDALGPRIENVTRLDDAFTSLFAPKPASGPDPLIHEIVVHFSDGPERTVERPYAAAFEPLVLEEGNYQLVGDAHGHVAIQSVELLEGISGPGLATTSVVLRFVEPLPDDRYSFTVSDRIQDVAGNPLDGESGASGPFVGNDGRTPTPPIFPTGDGNHGGDFFARFTVDSRPEIGVWSAGSIYIDTNGNYVFDQDNLDHTNRDLTYVLGFTSDDVFAGNFAGFNQEADGYDKIAAYGHFGAWPGSFRWLIDTDNDGVADIRIDDPANVNGVPVAGDFDGNERNGDEVGLFTGSTWYFDTNHDFKVDFPLPTEARGYPAVGDFDGDGFDDLVNWSDDTFVIDLAQGQSRGWDGKVDHRFGFGFTGVRERPVAADLDQDGYADLGLWVPDRGGLTPREASEWFWLLSAGTSLLDRIEPAPDVVRGNHQVIRFSPHPLGPDLFAQFGDEFAVPVVGNFDPPSQGLPVVEPELHTNPEQPLDVSGDGVVSPRDALLAINHLNTVGSSPVADLPATDLFLDANADDFVSPLDVLVIVNHLNRAAATEAAAVQLGRAEALAGSGAVEATDLLWALAAEQLPEEDGESESD